MGTIIGSFGKGVDGSCSLNFGVSGGKHCSKRCRHHPTARGKNATRSCYAAALEVRPDRAQLQAKLERHEKMPAARIVAMALLELQELERKNISIPWFRFSTNGSLPMPADVSPLFRSQLRALCSWLVSRGIPIHLPVESAGKAEFYRSIVGDIVTVRESLQRPGDHTTTQGAVSWVVGAEISGKDTFRRRIAAARTQASERYAATGRKTVVCPAIVASFLQRLGAGKNEKTKCGSCNACALQHIDIVYPKHK